MQVSEFLMTFTRKTGSFVPIFRFMKRRTIRANNTFLLGSLVMIVLVLVIVVLFLFMSFRIFDKKQATHYSDRYDIILEESTLGSPLSVYMNDSLLCEGTPQSTLTLSVGRFAKESSLLIVDGETDIVSTIALPDHSETVRIEKKENGVFRRQVK